MLEHIPTKIDNDVAQSSPKGEITIFFNSKDSNRTLFLHMKTSFHFNLKKVQEKFNV